MISESGDNMIKIATYYLSNYYHHPQKAFSRKHKDHEVKLIAYLTTA